MKSGCAWIIGIIVLIYAINNPELLWFGGAIVAIAVVIGVFSSWGDARKAKAAALAKAEADAAFLNSVPATILPALNLAIGKDFDPKEVPSIDRPMPAMSQNPLKYSDNTAALTAHVDYLDARMRGITDCVKAANDGYRSALGILEKQQADLYRLAFRAAQNVASIETRFPGFAGKLDEVATGWAPPKPPMPTVYSPTDIAKAMKWLVQTPSAQIGGAIGRGDWRTAIASAVITAAVKVIQFQKIVREANAAHGTVELAAKKAVNQREELARAYERVAAISAEVRSRSETLLTLINWFAAQESAGVFAQPTLLPADRGKLLEMASFAHLARARAAQAA